jgi:hypothetical protein
MICPSAWLLVASPWINAQYGVFHKWGHHKNAGLIREILIKWMVEGNVSVWGLKIGHTFW